MAKKIIVGNWKMNPTTPREAKELFQKIKRKSAKLKKVTTVICPPAIYLPIFAGKNGNLKLGAQDAYFERQGAFTGRISSAMYKYMGAQYVILGHSEMRRAGETERVVNQKIKAALKEGLKVILCIGENERDSGGVYLKFLQGQLKTGLAKIPRANLKNITIAYEPVWAVGKKAKAVDTPEDFLHNKLFIRKVLVGIAGPKAGLTVPIIYGGSVNIENDDGFIKKGEADGLLIGRESLNADHFVNTLSMVENL